MNSSQYIGGEKLSDLIKINLSTQKNITDIEIKKILMSLIEMIRAIEEIRKESYDKTQIQQTSKIIS